MTAQEWGTRGVSGRNDGSCGLDHTLALELVRVTEAAAIAAGKWVGHGDENSGKAAAVDAMHQLIMSVSMRGVVVIGEGEKRDTPVLFKGADVGDGDGPVCDVGLSAGHGTLSKAGDVPYALAAIAVAERGAMYDPSPVRSMEKLAVGPECVDVVDVTRPVAENLRAVAKVKDVRVSDVVVAVLNRPRHRELVHEIRDAGARVHLLEGGDVAGAIAVARPESPVDLLLGTGGAAEGVIAAAGLSCLGGALQVRLRPGDPEKSQDLGEVLHTEDLVRGESVLFCATGVTGNELLRGVQNHAGRTTTQSIVMCSKPDTVRIVRSERRQARWREHLGIDFE
ncbi:fructose-bisphosphatase class II family protein [Amycolatopsis sp. FDAARGOS 1241]|uniref:fructose-bisphosphatase class II family protein n=1 Tax=Amycolatopsis sp. FDAARGOS 1241 TaxID=2778070 RepID=UPI0019506090|nr:fructose-bisphosphatase class II family protein [Amycolatopsis sp. FDAARGOS 1241]QRP45746.1 fructose-bisphosphatase class II family protein [Amycolatopsis sp. FDAARGOS 1241]